MGHPTTTINCAGPGAWLDQLTPTKAIYFKEDSIVGLDAGGPLITFADKDIEATLKQLFPGFDLLVSPNLLNKKLDKNHVKMLAAGKSPEQFLRKLRKSTNAIYISYYSPKTGKPTIAFLSRNDFMAKELFPTRALFTYKAPGSILKNIKIRADFNGLSGSSMSGVASDGTTVEAISTNGGAAETLFEGKSILDSSPANGNIIPEAANMNSGILGNDKLTVGNVEVSPEADEPASLIDEAQSKAACMNRLIFIEFGSLGYTRLSNGMVYFGGIGNRYSGQYEVKTVTHLIDNNGYNCRGVAQTSMIDGLSGVKPSAASVGQPSTEEVQLFDPKVSFNTLNPSDIGSSLASASVGANKMDEYLEDIFS